MFPVLVFLYFMLTVGVLHAFILPKKKSIYGVLFVYFVFKILIYYLSSSGLIVLPDSNEDASGFLLYVDQYFDGVLGLHDLSFFLRFLVFYVDLLSVDPAALSFVFATFLHIFIALLANSLYVMSLRTYYVRNYSEVLVFFILFFPTLFLYSSVMLAEIYIVFFLLSFFVFYYIAAINEGGERVFYFSLSLAAVLLGMRFHVVVLLAAVIFIALNRLYEQRFVQIVKGVIVLFFLLMILLVMDVHIDKIGNIYSVLEFDYDYFVNTRIIGNLRYPFFCDGCFFYYLTLPLFFLFSPFLFQLSSVAHLIGWVDSWIYLILVYLLYKVRRFYRGNYFASMCLNMVVSIIIPYSLAVHNSGTAIRHRIAIVPFLFLMLFHFMSYKLYSNHGRKCAT